jgi:hypothetical protein
MLCLKAKSCVPSVTFQCFAAALIAQGMPGIELQAGLRRGDAKSAST